MAKNRILVVEDDTAIQNFVMVNLRYTGYDCTSYSDGSEVYERLRRDHSFDLAILDIMLPGMDGFELMDAMKKHNIPVIYLTAKDDIDSKIRGLRDGAEDYMVKPFEILELLVRVEKVLERSGKLNRVLRYRDIIVDVPNHTVKRNDESVNLKPLEFELLAMLMKYKNRTLPRERLLNEIWGADYFGSDHTVEVHIAQIRKKLSLASDIKTVSKVGYRLEE